MVQPRRRGNSSGPPLCLARARGYFKFRREEKAEAEALARVSIFQRQPVLCDGRRATKRYKRPSRSSSDSFSTRQKSFLSLSPSGGIKFFHSMYFRSLEGWIDFSRLLLLYTLEGVDYYFIYYYIRRNDYYTILLLSRSCLDILNMQCVVLLIAVIF